MNLDYVKKQRGLDFLKKGMRVELAYGSTKKQGIIKDGNSSGNIDVLFDGEKISKNCHPTWAMKYFDKEGNVIADYPDLKFAYIKKNIEMEQQIIKRDIDGSTSTKEFIDFICPEHGRTSCSDENISNGFCLEEDGETISQKYHHGCVRCALLEIENGTIKKSEANKKIILTSLIF